MNDKIKELVEWVATTIKKTEGGIWIDETTQLAKQILSHPDLALKVDKICPECKGKTTIEVGILSGGVFRGRDLPCPTCGGAGVKSKKIILLAEAIKEMKK